MKTIWKFPLNVTDEDEIQMPIGAQVLTVECQQGAPYLWALVETTNAQESRVFSIFGTGHPIEKTELQYRGTFQLNGGNLVFHVFEQ